MILIQKGSYNVISCITFPFDASRSNPILADLTELQDLPASPAIAKLQRGLVLRANSVLITIYGDVMARRGQAVWLGSLIRLGSMFGLSPRLVRTSAFRLSADDWLTCTRLGRRSFYALSEAGLQRVQHAERRIYDFKLPHWDGYWTLAILGAGMPASARLHLKRELRWEGFGELSLNVFAHPHASHTSLKEIIRTAGAQEQLVVLRAESIAGYSSTPLQNVMHATFKLDQVEAAFKQFLARFEPMMHQAANLTPEESFCARTLLIHEYRKVLLRDPNLPQALLPIDWSGLLARQLCEALYGELFNASETFLLSQVEVLDGKLTKTARRSAKSVAHNG